MAGDWIKMRTALGTSPKVVRLSSALKADRFRIIGGLHSAWCLFDAHSEDGKLVGYSTTILDDLIGWPGFSQAMVDVGWLEVDGESLCLPRFEAHNGQSAKRRAMDADRKRVRRLSASDADTCPKKVSPREEKRREEINTAVSAEAPGAVAGSGTVAGSLAVALNRAGFRCTSMNPDLIAAADEGVTVEHMQQVAAMDCCRGKPAGYVIAIARREMSSGPSQIKPEVQYAAHREAGKKLSPADQVAQSIAERMHRGGRANPD